MNAFKRAITNIKRQPGKNGVLFFLILVLATALSGAISVRQAINNTDESVMLRTPALATLSLNIRDAAKYANVPAMELGFEIWSTNRPTIEDISAIGNLPYVRAYDAALQAPILLSRELEWAMVNIDEEQLPEGISSSALESSIIRIFDHDSDIEFFIGRGVANPDLGDIGAGLIELVAGRTFTQAEIDNAEQVAIIPQAFAQVNDLYVGASFELENMVHNYAKAAREEVLIYPDYWYDERFLAAHQVLEFEVIGIFDTHGFDYQNYDAQNIILPFNEYARLYNQIYMPFSVAEDISTVTNEAMLSMLDDFLEFFYGTTAEEFIQEEPWIQSLFILYDPRDIDAFQYAASELLPGFWEVNSLHDINASLINSMDTIINIADMILFAAVFASIAILTLIITLLLRDRRREIGIYMALGEKKGKIIFQFLTEIIMIATVATVIALFIGNGISTALSRNLIEQHLTQNVEHGIIRFGDGALPFELMPFNPGEISIEETLEMYDTSLDAATISTFLGVGIVVIFLSTVIPIAYVVKMKPKEVLIS